ncbi:MAG: hypothetical protein JSU96_05405 [Acidobacteriota bacterium]|nr:MAG: hypothetical protein JSU96_05405 [Acidobacteriota bacterium]
MKEAQIEQLIAGIKSQEPEQRTVAWRSAGSVGAPAIQPLASLAAERNHEVGRAANRAIWQIVRSAGTPGQEEGKSEVIGALKALLTGETPVSLQRDIIWMLSEIACADCVADDLSALLQSPELREDARCALERIPGQSSLNALREALQTVPEDFKMNIVQSLRAKGEEVPGYPCRKLALAERAG